VLELMKRVANGFADRVSKLGFRLETLDVVNWHFVGTGVKV